jgi:hypothetical protein
VGLAYIRATESVALGDIEIVAEKYENWDADQAPRRPRSVACGRHLLRSRPGSGGESLSMRTTMPGDTSRNNGLEATAHWTAAARAQESGRSDGLFVDAWAAALAGPDGMSWLPQRTRSCSTGFEELAVQRQKPDAAPLPLPQCCRPIRRRT